MKTKVQNLQSSDDAGANLNEPRFDVKAEEAARPVVPLEVAVGGYAGQARGRRVRGGRAMNAWPRGILLALAVVAVAAIGAFALYRSGDRAQSTAAPQTLREASMGEAPEPAHEPVSAAASEAVSRTASTEPVRPDVAAAHVEQPGQPAARGDSPARDVAARDVRDVDVRREAKASEPRERDQEMFTERTRKEEKRLAKQARKESEKLADERGDSGKSTERKPRLIGIYTERPRP